MAQCRWASGSGLGAWIYVSLRSVIHLHVRLSDLSYESMIN